MEKYSRRSGFHYFFIMIFPLVFFYPSVILSQSGSFEFSEKQISSALTYDGFENIVVKIDSLDIVITYENRIYRSEIDAVSEILRIVAQFEKNDLNLVLIPQFRKIPTVLIKIPLKLFREAYFQKKQNLSFDKIDVSMDCDFYWNKIKNISRKNNSSFKNDIIINPQVKAVFGNYNEPAETQVNIAPELKNSFWKGMSASLQLILPIKNDFDSTGDYIRPGLLTLNQFLALPFNSFFSGTVGNFTDNRYGINLELKKYFDYGKFSLGANTAFTNYAVYVKGIWYHIENHLFTYSLSFTYRFPLYDLKFNASYGKYIESDRGVRFDVSRQFGETQIGFFFLKTNIGDNGGFNFSFPLFPSKYWSPGIVRVRPSESFDWEYKAKFNKGDGKSFKTGNSIDEILKEFNPDYLKNQLIRFLKNN